MEAVVGPPGPAPSTRPTDDFAFDFDIDADGALDSSSPAHDPRFHTPTLSIRAALPMRRMTPGPMARVTPAPTPSAALSSRPPLAEMMLPAPWPTAPSPARPISGTMAAVDPHAALVAFAGFGDPPRSVWTTPAYAVRVAMRKRSLRADLVSARSRRSHDVGIYEASLRSADDRAVRNGFILMATFAAIAALLVVAVVRLMPVVVAFGG